MSSMGMDKSGDQNLAASTWTKLTSFVIRSGYPATVISAGNGLVMNATATGVFRWRGQFVTNDGTRQFRVVKTSTGAVIGTASNNGVVGTSPTTAVTNGEEYELQGYVAPTNPYSFNGNVSGGAASTFLEFNQTTTNQNLDAARGVDWATSAQLGLGVGLAAADRQVTWGRSAELSAEASLPVVRSVSWASSADLYQGQKLDVDSVRQIDWNVTADLLHIQPASNFTPSFDAITVSVETVDGRSVGGLYCDVINGITWGREQNEVSTCTINVMTEGDPDLLEDIRPWLHWITVWHADRPMWRGPIQSMKRRPTTSDIVVRDPATFMWRTRVPITKTWVDTDPTVVAGSVLAQMMDLHRIKGEPLVLPNASQPFSYSADADSRMVHQLMDDLVKLGLKWTVVGGKFILGEFDKAPFVELSECDFLVEIERLRDGTSTFNDVRVQGKNFAQTAVVPLAGLRLQTLVSLDDVYGVSNIQRATQQYVEDTSRIRDVLYVPGGASLHPDAPVTMSDLMPGRVVKVSAYGLTNLMEIDQVQFTISPTAYDRQVTLVAIHDQTELAELAPGGTSA